MQSNKGEIKPLIASETETQHSIYRVHKHLRKVNKKAYKPEIIAIGPYHHGKDHLEMMEKHKRRYLQLLLRRRPDIYVDTYFSTIGQLEQQARDCYAQPIDEKLSEPDKFVEMLVLDGCFIIELVRKDGSQDSTCENDPIFQMQWIKSSLQRDLILFENQIPFFVLSKLFDLIEGPGRHNRLINRLLSFCPNLEYPRVESTNRQPSKSMQEIKHLLDLVYDSYISSTDAKERGSYHLEREIRFINCATKLKDASVKFEKKERNEKKERDTLVDVKVEDDIIMERSLLKVEDDIIMERSLLKVEDDSEKSKRKELDILVNVEFKDGIMQIPPLTVEDRTECFFRNLIAYEQYFLNGSRKVITDYATFLTCLIDSSRDVEILSEHKIIDNWLGDDEVVAGIFNRLTNSINTRDERFCYAKMFKTVNRHYQSSWNRSLAKLRQDVFFSPWAKISFVVGVVLLVLTVAQTVCSILSVV